MNIKKTLAIIVPLALIGTGFYFKKLEKNDEILVRAIFENLKNFHYSPPTIDDEFSKKAFGEYVKNIDNNKRFLLQEDIDYLNKYQLFIDDMIQSGTYSLMDEMSDIMKKRIDLCESFADEILSSPFDFERNESVDFGEDLPWSKNEKELKERWRKFLKYSTMTRLASYLKTQEDAQAQNDSSVRIQPYDSLEAKARKMVAQNQTDWFKRLRKMDRKDQMNIYLNSLTSLFDPHTNYFPPSDKDNFDIGITGRLEGIGARLQEKDGYIQIVDVVPGGPAAMQGELKAKDIILKVAQENEEAVEIVDWKIDNAVKIIRGPKGSVVTLTVKSPDGIIKDIAITRDVVVLEETYVKSSVMMDDDQVKIGYIYLPGFYTDFTGNGGRTSYQDVKNELIKLKEEGVEAIVFDLRNNGGGSLQDVVDMAGLFIDKGPIVQVKSRFGSPYVMSDKNRGILWDGPLVVMVNEFSASASEIFAAALQDYGRALVVGSHTTHGKGTVQRFINLNETLRSPDAQDLGAIKVTMQKFYRINGGATQLKGVTPDIIWTDNYTYIPTGEKEQDFPLQWDQIEQAEYEKLSGYLTKMDAIKKKSAARTSGSDIFNAFEENAQRWKAQSERDAFPLKLSEYRKDLENREKVNKQFEEKIKPIEAFDLKVLKSDLKDIESDSLKLKRMNDWHNGLKKDVYLYETLQVAEDLL